MADRYRGFMCKPAALLAAMGQGHDLVALLDLDAVLIHRSARRGIGRQGGTEG